ncbi:TIGR03943 family protein [Klenkia sp. LSe6-5]|uniref:TIGR03943 family protein n=1 Tax=Klenkia sesuvii TaxID=3103137 RepID=A0ABU8DSG8_9ACTN
MSRTVQHLVLLLLGAVTLSVSLGQDYLSYVKGGYRPVLVVAGALVVLLALHGLLRGSSERVYHRLGGLLYDSARSRAPQPRRGGRDEHDHQHEHAPRVAWLLLAPVAVLLVVAPSALGAFTAARQAAPAPVAETALAQVATNVTGLGPDDEGRPYRTMALMAYAIWSRGNPDAFEGRQVRLEGFLTPRAGGGWYVSRILISCCAADAIPVSVVLDGPATEDWQADQWVEVIGHWAPPQLHPTGGYPEAVITVDEVTPTDRPADSYED